MFRNKFSDLKNQFVIIKFMPKNKNKIRNQRQFYQYLINNIITSLLIDFNILMIHFTYKSSLLKY